ncbi:HK97-gp10 family putative phage morphogenesis protein, partial [Acinetobacter sp. V2]|uniref:HK97-gp10 family putative phage morphogenesis protein n=1 Tax=Acinetobacter sp. V2 TaxID=1051623 RepID=UPI000620142F
FLENDTRHFWLVEFGTAKTKAQPFMRPALESNIDSVTEAVAAKLKNDILGDIN